MEALDKSLVIWEKIPDECRNQVQVTKYKFEPKTKMNIENYKHAEPEENPDDQIFIYAHTATTSIFNDRTDSIVSFERANLNTSVNLGSFISQN